jgi:RimJ/RimL family protein N-acetyltransferase
MIQMMKIAEVWPSRNHDGNINSTEVVAALRASMCRFGWMETYPLVISRKDSGNYGVADGNHRLSIARELFGDEYEIPVAIDYHNEPVPVGYVELKVTNFPILIGKRRLFWVICIRDTTGQSRPKEIGRIDSMGEGELPNTSRLAWDIEQEYRGLGIMKFVLPLFCSENIPQPGGYEAKIRKGNWASLRVAEASGFVAFKESEDYHHLLKK